MDNLDITAASTEEAQEQGEEAQGVMEGLLTP